tara:strand:- start:7 stop:402 length:396 start_codon:yes stop_codon:yes gene_type:complete
MEDNFLVEIISPEKIILSEKVKMVTVPSYEGDMSILKNHISIITFLRPGRVTIQKEDKSFEDFFIEDGTVEFFNDSLVILSASAINIKNLSKEFIEKLNKEAEEKLVLPNITDKDRYILGHKINVLKEVRI